MGRRTSIADPGLLAAVRGVFDALAEGERKEFEIYRPTRTKDGQAGRTLTYPDTPEATTAGLLYTFLSQNTEMPVAGKVQARYPYMVAFPSGADVRGDDRLKSDGRTFEVLIIQAGVSFEVAVQAFCVELR